MTRQIQLSPKYVTDEQGVRQMVLLDLAEYNLLVELALKRLADETTLASEPALARIWNNQQEDRAWGGL